MRAARYADADRRAPAVGTESGGESVEFEHLGARPRIHRDAVVAQTAVVSGDVTIGADCQLLHGAVVTSEGGPIILGENVIVMENAVIRGSAANPVHIG